MDVVFEVKNGNPVIHYGWRRKPFVLYNIPQDDLRWVKGDFATRPTGITATAADFVWRHFGRKRYAKMYSQYSDWSYVRYWSYVRFARYAAWLLSWPGALEVNARWGHWCAKPEYYWHLRKLYSFDIVDWR